MKTNEYQNLAIFSLLMMSMGMSPYYNRTKDEPNFLDNLDIEAEMELIKSKKSKLSYSERSVVEKIYKRMLKEKEQNNEE